MHPVSEHLLYLAAEVDRIRLVVAAIMAEEDCGPTQGEMQVVRGDLQTAARKLLALSGKWQQHP